MQMGAVIKAAVIGMGGKIGHATGQLHRGDVVQAKFLKAGRALLWDKQVDRQLWNDYRQARVAQKPYVYQTNAD